jgi:hypothetical protein
MNGYHTIYNSSAVAAFGGLIVSGEKMNNSNSEKPIFKIKFKPR